MAEWLKAFGGTFLVIFLAELGDKTQLAALGLSAKSVSPWAVFLGSSAALVITSAIAVLGGALLGRYLNPRYVHYGASALFVAVGVYMLVRGPDG